MTLWVGAENGLASSTNEGMTWGVFAELPTAVETDSGIEMTMSVAL